MATKKRFRKPSRSAAAPAAAEQKFKRDLLIRGEAASLDENGKLPLEATHEIIEVDKKDPGKSKIVRRRFKLY